MAESENTLLYEIVVLNNGQVALKKIGDDNADPLVTVQFSEQAKYFLGSSASEVARAMIEAGLDAVSNLEDFSMEELDSISVDESEPILH